MATLKYKTPDGEWKKVSIGGGGSTEEVYVGSDEPTDENVKVWIDPTGTPSGGNGGNSGGGANVYVFPDGMADAVGGVYVFSDEETASFKAIESNITQTLAILPCVIEGASFFVHSNCVALLDASSETLYEPTAYMFRFPQEYPVEDITLLTAKATGKVIAQISKR